MNENDSNYNVNINENYENKNYQNENEEEIKIFYYENVFNIISNIVNTYNENEKQILIIKILIKILKNILESTLNDFNMSFINNLNNNFEQKIKLESKFENTSHMIFNNSGSIIIKTFYNHINGLTYFFKYNRKSDGNKFFITDEDIEFNKELPKTNKLVIKLEIIKERFIVCLKENGNISIFNLFLYEIKNIDNNQIYIDFEKVPGTFFFITTNKNYKHELYDLNLEENNMENNENFIIKFQEPILYKYIKFSKDVGCFVAYEDNLTFFVPEI
jgi:hypothetical protein